MPPLPPKPPPNPGVMSTWVAVLGAGPFEVVAVADHSEHRLRPGLVLRTDLGEVELSEVWREPDD